MSVVFHSMENTPRIATNLPCILCGHVISQKNCFHFIMYHWLVTHHSAIVLETHIDYGSNWGGNTPKASTVVWSGSVKQESQKIKSYLMYSSTWCICLLRCCKKLLILIMLRGLLSLASNPLWVCCIGICTYKGDWDTVIKKQGVQIPLSKPQWKSQPTT